MCRCDGECRAVGKAQKGRRKTKKAGKGAEKGRDQKNRERTGTATGGRKNQRRTVKKAKAGQGDDRKQDREQIKKRRGRTPTRLARHTLRRKTAPFSALFTADARRAGSDVRIPSWRPLSPLRITQWKRRTYHFSQRKRTSRTSLRGAARSRFITES